MSEPTVIELGKNRVYVDDPSEVPDDVQVHEGDEGGLYYNPSDEGETADDADSSASAPDSLSELEEGDRVEINGREGVVEGVGAFGDTIDFYDEQDDEVYTIREGDVDSISDPDEDETYSIEPLDTEDVRPTATDVSVVREDDIRPVLSAMESRYDEANITAVRPTYTNDLGYYDTSTGVIHVNQDILDEMEEDPAYEDWLVDASVESLIIHETVHQLHYDAGEVNGEAELEDDEEEVLEEEVSPYAAYNPREAIAEIGVGLLIGEEWPEEVMEIYEKYGGPEL